MATNNSINKTSDSIAKLATITGSNGNTVMTLSDQASAVNYLTTQNNTTGNPAKIIAAGSDTDIGIDVNSKGAGAVTVNAASLRIANGSTGPGVLRFYEDSDNGSNYVALQAPSSLSANATYTLPSANSDGVLTNTSGTLSWESGTGSAGVTIIKALNEARTSNTTYTTDSDLFFTAAANATYLVRVQFRVSSSASPDWKYRIVMPTGSYASGIIIWSDDLNTSAALATKTEVITSGTAWGTTVGNVASTTVYSQYMDALIRTGGSSGTIGLQWAQVTSDAIAATVYAGATLYYVEAV